MRIHCVFHRIYLNFVAAVCLCTIAECIWPMGERYKNLTLSLSFSHTLIRIWILTGSTSIKIMTKTDTRWLFDKLDFVVDGWLGVCVCVCVLLVSMGRMYSPAGGERRAGREWIERPAIFWLMLFMTDLKMYQYACWMFGYLYTHHIMHRRSRILLCDKSHFSVLMAPYIMRTYGTLKNSLWPFWLVFLRREWKDQLRCLSI